MIGSWEIYIYIPEGAAVSEEDWDMILWGQVASPEVLGSIGYQQQKKHVALSDKWYCNVKGMHLIYCEYCRYHWDIMTSKRQKKQKLPTRGDQACFIYRKPV